MDTDSKIKKIHFVCKITKFDFSKASQVLERVDWDIGKFAQIFLNEKWGKSGSLLNSVDGIKNEYERYLINEREKTNRNKDRNKQGVRMSFSGNKLIYIQFASKSEEVMISPEMDKVVIQIAKKILNLTSLPADMDELLKIKVEEGKKFSEWVNQLGQKNFKENLLIVNYQSFSKKSSEVFSVFNQLGHQSSSFCVLQGSEISNNDKTHIAAHLLATAKEELPREERSVIISLRRKDKSFLSKQRIGFLDKLLCREFLFDNTFTFKEYLKNNNLVLVNLMYVST